MDNFYDELIFALKSVAVEIRLIEADASVALHEQGDEGFYRNKMREKTEILRDLPEIMKNRVDQLPRKEREKIALRLDRFSMSASTALKLNSVFYMSALLYPEDHRAGEPNDLERFISMQEQGWESKSSF